jgi:Aldehyde dehydrogenase family
VRLWLLILMSTKWLHRVNGSRQIDCPSIRGQLKKVSLELGGKSPNIIFGDADLVGREVLEHYTETKSVVVKV